MAGLFLVGRSFYRIYTRKPLVVETPAEDKAAKLRLAAVRDQDIEVLEKSAERPPAEVAKSLRRLQRQSADDAGKYIAQFINSDDEVIQAAAIEAAAALGLKEFEQQVRGAFNSKNKEIRLSVIRGLGQQPNTFSNQLVRSHWDKGLQDEQERFVTLLTLQRISPAEDRSSWQDILVKELRAYKGKIPPTEWVDVFKSLPSNPELVEGAWTIVRNAQPDEVSFRALMYLRDFAGGAALKSGLSTVSIPAHRRYQMVLVDLLFDYCPTGWNDIVERIMSSDPHPLVKKGLEEAELSVKCL